MYPGKGRLIKGVKFGIFGKVEIMSSLAKKGVYGGLTEDIKFKSWLWIKSTHK
ncbi:hypothetical protein Lalb_Chr12g0201781 [Lupinus albus]|uniref:Uncharacterized protein n=1 Tax=Lupinus albus TaxID=3870 RepID=A0A6A4PM93_LUPAL|nr:hypothetical protein Lalb_Chr12g0201781 [Lupinus albus]